MARDTPKSKTYLKYVGNRGNLDTTLSKLNECYLHTESNKSGLKWGGGFIPWLNAEDRCSQIQIEIKVQNIKKTLHKDTDANCKLSLRG